MAVGSWSVSLSPETPRGIVDALGTGYFGHLVVATGRQDPRVAGDSLFAAGRFTGVMTGANFQTLAPGKGPTISGDGLATWLGTPSNVGDVLENATLFTSASFATVANFLRPASVGAGTIYSVAGSGIYTGTFVWKTRREALTSFCQQMSTGSLPTQTVEWRMNNNNTLDLGPVSSLYVTSPTTAVVARSWGVDMRVRALQGTGQLTEDVKDYTTRTVVLASGSGTSTAVGAASLADVGAAVQYYDFYGNPVKMTRMISASSVSSYNATASAQSALIPYTTPRDQIKLSTQDYDIDGQLQVGDYVWVYDADAGLVDYTNEIVFRGQRINPSKIRVIEATWPIVEGMTVAFRTPRTPTNPAGTWIDLTDYVVWESGDTTLVVGGYNRNLVPTSEPVGPRPQPDTTIPGVPVFGAFSTTAYQGSSDGRTKAQIQANWSTPANTDGTTMTDLDHYEIQYRPDLGVFAQNPSYNGLQSAGYTYNSLAALGGSYNQLIPQAVANWKVTFVAGGVNNLLVQELTPGVNYDFQIRAVDTAQPPNRGAWSGTTTFQAQRDTIPPQTPDAPTVATNMASVQVTWDCGSATGGTFNQAVDLHHIEVHGSQDPLFQPSNSTKLGNLPANIGNITGQIPVVGSFTLPPGSIPANAMWIKIVAVDEAGNKSQPSAAAGSTATLWTDAFISDLSVSKLTAGTITASVILGSTISTASTGQRVTMDGAHDALFTYDNTGALIGAWAGIAGTDPADAVAYAAGWTIFNNPGPGYFAVQSKSLSASLYATPDLVLTAQPSYSSTLARIHVDASGFADTFETLKIDGAIAAGDANKSWAQIQMVSAGTSPDASHGQLLFNDNANGIVRLLWDQHGVLIAGGAVGSTFTGNPLLTDLGQNAGTNNFYRVSFPSVFSGTTNASGQITFSHGAAFTPVYCFAMTSFGTIAQLYFDNFTSTQFRATCYSAAGVLINAGVVNFLAMMLG